MTMAQIRKRSRQMRPLTRAEQFSAVQRESTEAVTVWRKALFSVSFTDASSPVQGGFSKSASPSVGGAPGTRSRSGGGPGWGLTPGVRTTPTGTIAYYLGTDNGTDRRNSRLRCYFRHSG